MAILRRTATVILAAACMLALSGCGDGPANKAADTASTAPKPAIPAPAGLPEFKGESRPFAYTEGRPTAPAFTFKDADGKDLTLADRKGKVLLVNLWATWCAPCVKEMPSLDRLQAELGGPDFEVVAISLDRGGLNEVKPFFEANGIKALAPYLDPQMTAMKAAQPLPGLPTSILVDREGREVGRLPGAADWSGEEAKALIRAVMDNPS